MKKQFFTKQRIETILTAIGLILLIGVIHIVTSFGIINKFPYLLTIMLVSTAVYVFVGCMLQTFGFKRIAIAVGVVVFFILCTCLFYSTYWLDYGVFVICMAVVVRKSSKMCGSMGCENPLA